VHVYCCYHPQAGPVRPDKVTNLRVDGDTVKWSWSENSFDLASPGARFERQLTLHDGQLAWRGEVVRTPNARAEVAFPEAPAAGDGLELRLEDVGVEYKRGQAYGNDHVAIHVRHAPSGSELVWDGTSDAEEQDIGPIGKKLVGRLLHLEFVYRTAENGSRHASNWNLFVRLGHAGLELVPLLGKGPK